ALARPPGARARADRLLGPGVLARPGRASCFLRPARLGGRTRAARRRVRVRGRTLERPRPPRQSSRRGARGVPERAGACGAAGGDPRLPLARLHRADDPVVHAGGARPGVRRCRASQGPERSPRDLASRAWQRDGPLPTRVALSEGYLPEGAVVTGTGFVLAGLGLYLQQFLFN